MAHRRTEIRNAVKSMLESAAPAGWSIRRGRGRAIALEDCPCLEIAIPSETEERGAQRKRRELVLTLTTYVASAEDGDTACDDAAVWQEAALDADPTLAGTAQDASQAQTEIEPHTGGETPVWQMTITYNLRVS